jgi:hypothetical protein
MEKVGSAFLSLDKNRFYNQCRIYDPHNTGVILADDLKKALLRFSFVLFYFVMYIVDLI